MRNQLLLAAIFLAALSNIYGQIHLEMEKVNVDSLQNVLPLLNGKERIDALNQLAFGICRKNPDSTIEIASRVVQISDSINYKKGMADGFFNLGNGYFFLDSIKPRVSNYLAALRIYEELPPSIEMGLVLDQLRHVNQFLGRYERAKQYERRAIGVFQSLSLPGYELRAWTHYSALYTYNHEFDSALYYYEYVNELLKKHPEDWIQSTIYINMGWNYEMKFSYEGGKKEDIENAIYWTLKGMEYDQQLLKSGDLSLEDYITGLSNVGIFYYALGTEEGIKTGLDYIRKAKRMSDTLDIYVHHKLSLARYLAKHERKLGNFNKAIEMLQTSIIEADKSKARVTMKDYRNPYYYNYDNYYTALFKKWTYLVLYKIYDETGNYKEALKYYILKEEEGKKIFEEDKQNLIALLEAESESEKTEKKISLLEQANQLKEYKIRQSQFLIWGIVLVFAIIILMGFLFIRQNKLKTEHSKTLLEQKLLRLQMNPHFIFNAITSILTFIENNENKKASNYLTTFSKLMRATLESTREDLIPFEKELSTLKNYLDLQKVRYPDQLEYNIEVDEKIDQEETLIPPMLVQPFIENSIEHGIRHKGEMGHLDIRFILMDKKILCEVEDDGVGREKAWEAEITERDDRKSMAIEIISDRIAALNKKFRQKLSLDIIDKPAGTLIRLDLPYILD